MEESQRDLLLAKGLAESDALLALDTAELDRLDEDTIAAKRRRHGQPRASQLATLSLVRSDGVLKWTYQRPPSRVGPRRSRFRAARMVGARPVAEFKFQEVPANEVIDKLQKLDAKLTPNQGLRRWNGNALVPIDKPAATSRALLFIHGTFSKSEVFFDELRSSPGGVKFLEAAMQSHKQILAFEHPTLAVSPILNACDLERALGDFKGTLDVVCHSRGGLVAAWWLRIGERNVKRLVCVGSPLEGTSLAAPARIKTTLDYYANVADAISTAGSVAGGFVPPLAPLLGVAAGLMGVLGGVLAVGAHTPLIDAGVVIVPGLASQSRVENNQELERLHRDPWRTQADIFAIQSDFEPGDPNAKWWEFWRRWNRPLMSATSSAAKHIFAGQNDLVVDTDKVIKAVTAIPRERVFSFGTNNRVHHCNYFAQPETIAKLREWLDVGLTGSQNS